MIQFYFNLEESIPNLTDWIQALAALGVLGLTGIMAYYAKQALNTWKDQKITEVIVEAKANVLLCIDIFERLTDFSEIIRTNLPKQETAAYQGMYSVFFISSFKNNLTNELLNDALRAYDRFKEATMNDKMKLTYECTKVVTFKTDSKYLKNDLEQIQALYNNILLKYQRFDVSIKFLRVTLLHKEVTESKTFDDVKKTIDELQSFKTESVKSLSKQAFDLIIDKTN